MGLFISCGDFSSGVGESLANFVGELTGADFIKSLGVFCVNELKEEFLELGHFVKGNVFKQALGTAEDHGDLVGHFHRGILRLDEETLVFAAFVDNAGGDGVDVATELGERFELAELCLVNLQGTCHFFHRLDLGVTTYT